MLSLTREGCGILHIIVYVTSFPVSIFISSSTIKTVLYVLVCSVLRHYCEPTRHETRQQAKPQKHAYSCCCYTKL